jgi:hypothetical protein
VWRRALALGVPCLVVLATLAAIAWALREPARRGLPQRASIEGGVLKRFELWRARRGPGARRGAVLFGDSLLVCSDRAPLATLLAARLAETGRSYDLLALAHPAFRPIIAYYLLDDVLAARPALVVVGLNLRELGTPSDDPSFRFAALSRRLSPARALAAREALGADELGPLAPPLYRLEERLDLLYVADGIRERGRSALDTAGWWLNRRLGVGDTATLRAVVADLQTRHDEGALRSAMSTYTTDFAASPQADVLRLALEELRAADARVLLYVSPVNVEYLAALGLSDAELALADRVEALRLAVGATPAEWLDLHASERADGFSDVWNHLTRPACERVARRLAAAIADG